MNRDLQLAPDGARGIAIVDQVIAGFQRIGDRPFMRYAGRELVHVPPAPLSAQAIEALRLADGAPLPPSLRRWLAYDGEHLGLAERFRSPAREMVDLLPEHWREAAAALCERLDGACHLLNEGDQTIQWLYVGRPDESGEYPVLNLSLADEAACYLLAPDFGVWLAGMCRMFDVRRQLIDDPQYRDAMAYHVARSLGGEWCFEF